MQDILLEYFEKEVEIDVYDTNTYRNDIVSAICGSRNNICRTNSKGGLK